MSAYSRFDTVDWVLIGYCIGVLVWWLSERIEQSTQPNPPVQRGQRVTLGEMDLSRLEDGDPLTLTRWHGGELVITGSEQIPVEVVDADDADDEESDP